MITFTRQKINIPEAGNRDKLKVSKSYKSIILAGVIWISMLSVPKAWSGTRFEMDPFKVASAETRMWQAYYANDHIALLQELTNLLHSQFGISVSDAKDIGEVLAGAAMKFESAESNYKPTVLPDLELAYSMLKNKLGVDFDPKVAAGAELDWWVARRTPGRDSVEEIGRLISHLYSVLFDGHQQDFEHAGLLRAQAAHLRDEGGKACDWGEVEQRLQESYQALQEGLKQTSNHHSGQVAISWDPNKENNIAGYKIYYGDSSGNYSSNVDVGNHTGYTITGLKSGKIYYFVITAYNVNGRESSYSAEISIEATVGITSQPIAEDPVEEHMLQRVKKRELQQINTSLQDLEVVLLSQGVDLTKHTKGPFTVKAMVKGIDEQQHPPFFPRVRYYIGTGSSYGYFDMINEGNNVWRFDIPDPKWYRYRSNSLHYCVKVFDEEGSIISKSRWEIELIDSFTQQD